MQLIVTMLHVLAAVLTTWRLTDIVATEQITAKLRAKVPLYLLTCVRCLSVWAGIATTIAWLVFPWANWPLALAWTYLWFMESKGPYVRVRLSPKGIRIDSSLDVETAKTVLTQTVNMLTGSR